MERALPVGVELISNSVAHARVWAPAAGTSKSSSMAAAALRSSGKPTAISPGRFQASGRAVAIVFGSTAGIRSPIRRLAFSRRGRMGRRRSSTPDNSSGRTLNGRASAVPGS